MGTRGHRCMGKGKSHYIEVLSDSEEEEEAEKHKIVSMTNQLRRSHRRKPRVELSPLYRVSPYFTPSRSGVLYRVNESPY
jgi:hypothetical protein